MWGADAHEFCPDRWLVPGRMPPPAELPSGWSGILTFCDGPRNCVGWRLGTLPPSTLLILDLLLHHLPYDEWHFLTLLSRFVTLFTDVLLFLALFDSRARVQGDSGDAYPDLRVPRHQGCSAPADIANAPTRSGRRSWYPASPRYAGEYVKQACVLIYCHALRWFGFCIDLRYTSVYSGFR